jgi:hypothetical protein
VIRLVEDVRFVDGDENGIALYLYQKQDGYGVRLVYSSQEPFERLYLTRSCLMSLKRQLKDIPDFPEIEEE